MLIEIICYLVFSLSLPSIDQIDTSPVKVEFANRLFEEGDYHAALIEYRRYLHRKPDDPRSPYLRYRIGVCYLHLGDYDRAENTFRSLEEEADGELRKKVVFGWAKSLYLADEYGRMKQLLLQFRELDLNGADKFLLGLCALEELRWMEAAANFRQAASANRTEDKEKLMRLAKETLVAMKTGNKSRAWSGIFSAVLPGAGMISNGSTLRGLGYLAGTSSLAFLAMRAAQSERYLDLGVISSLFIWLYFRNIKMSLADADENNLIRERICAEQISEEANRSKLYANLCR